MSVTAVPLHPLTRGTVPKLWIGIVLLVLGGLGLAWVSTHAVGAVAEPTWIAGNDGLRYAVWQQGTGAPVTRDDVFTAEVEQRDPSGELMHSTLLSGNDQPLTVDQLPPFLRPVAVQMHEGGQYEIKTPLRLWLAPGAASPNPRWNVNDEVEIRFKVHNIARGGLALLQQQQEEQMMRQQAMQQQIQQMQAQRGGGAGAPGGRPVPGGAASPHPTTPGGER